MDIFTFGANTRRRICESLSYNADWQLFASKTRLRLTAVLLLYTSHAHFDCDTFIYECTEVRGAYVAVVADYVDQAVAWADPGYATWQKL